MVVASTIGAAVMYLTIRNERKPAAPRWYGRGVAFFVKTKQNTCKNVLLHKFGSCNHASDSVSRLRFSEFLADIVRFIN